LRDYGASQKFSDASITKVVATPAALCLFRNYRHDRIGLAMKEKTPSRLDVEFWRIKLSAQGSEAIQAIRPLLIFLFTVAVFGLAFVATNSTTVIRALLAGLG
jgi:hypothetical protein